MRTFDTLADDYASSRLGYADELYDALVGAGLTPGMRVLDVGCGTGLASGPLIDNNFEVTGIDPSQPMLDHARRQYPAADWRAGIAEKLPVADGKYDAVIAAQSFHHVGRTEAMAEIVRVLRPGGLAAVWWKHLMADDPVRHMRDDAARALGFDPPGGGLPAGFKEFYASPLHGQTLRVIPWRTGMRLSQYIRYERSRKNVRETMGGRTEEYLAALESRLRDRFGMGDPFVPLTYTHYLYLAKK